MLIPTYGQNRFDAQILAVVTFLTIQIGSYAVTWFVGFLVLPVFLAAMPISLDALHITLALFRLAIFFGLREVVITVLWHWLTQRLNTSSAELDAISYLAV